MLQRYINLLSTLIVDNDARVRLEERTTQVGVGEGGGTALLQSADTLLRFLRLNPSADLKVVEEAPAPAPLNFGQALSMRFGFGIKFLDGGGPRQLAVGGSGALSA